MIGAAAWEHLSDPQYVIIGAVILLQAALISWLLHERKQRRRSEAEARALTGQLINAQEEERARLARELHDDVTQRLAVLTIEVTNSERRLERHQEGSALRSIRQKLARLNEDVHALSYRLHPSILEDLGLLEALNSEFRNLPFPVELNIDSAQISEKLPKDLALCLFRIAQEGLRNATRHSGASAAEISLTILDGGLQLLVRDNGRGFDIDEPRDKRGLGLSSMRERVALLGGSANIESSPGRGTTIRAWVPFS